MKQKSIFVEILLLEKFYKLWNKITKLCFSNPCNFAGIRILNPDFKGVEFNPFKIRKQIKYFYNDLFETDLMKGLKKK